MATVCGGRAVLLPAIFAAGTRRCANCPQLNRQIRELERLVTHRKQTAATCSNSQEFQFCLLENLSASREFCPLLTGSGSQTEIDVTHSRQMIASFSIGRSHCGLRRSHVSRKMLGGQGICDMLIACCRSLTFCKVSPE